MSKIQDVPFITKVIDTLSDELKSGLYDLIDGQVKTPVFRSLVNNDYAITEANDKGKVQFVTLETLRGNYTGYLAYNSVYCVLIAFKGNTQALDMLNINVAKHTFSFVNEALTILELRVELEDGKEGVTPTDLGVTNNNIHLAKGTTQIGEGVNLKTLDGNTLIGSGNVGFKTINDQEIVGDGNIVVGEGGTITIDETTSTTSENALMNKTITNTFATKEVVENKANVDGNYPTMTVGNADNANNLIATKGLTVNDDPMSFGVVGGAQKSAVGDGNATLDKLVCVDVVKNQLANNRRVFSNGITFTANGNIVSFSGTATASWAEYIAINITAGNKYVIIQNTKTGDDITTHRVYDNTSNYRYVSANAIFTASSIENRLVCRLANLQGKTEYSGTFEYVVIDLTQRYGSNEVVNAIIGSDDTTQVAKLLAFDPEILNNTDYDEGTLVPSKTAKLVSKDEDDNVLGTVTLPNYEGHGILKVVDGKVVADGTELYPDGNSKKRYGIVDLGTLNWTFGTNGWYARKDDAKYYTYSKIADVICSTYPASSTAKVWDQRLVGVAITNSLGNNYTTIIANNGSTTTPPTGILAYKLATEEDITTTAYQSTFPVEQGGTLQFLDENDNPIAGLQGNEIFYQKNIKAFTEAFGEAIDWNPERIKRLAKLSITPEYVNISLNPSQANAYAVAQVYNATFTIVISTALTGTADNSITFQDSEIDLSSFETKPSESIYDMDGKKVSEEPTTEDCNIASFVGRSYNGIVLWSLLHSGVNKVKVHFEQAIPLDSEGNGKLDCRASLIL